MPKLKIILQNKKDIVKFQFLYSLHQHLGWPRSNKIRPQEISIFTTDELLKSNIKIISDIGNWVKLKIV